jgi:hypothetical protein
MKTQSHPTNRPGDVIREPLVLKRDALKSLKVQSQLRTGGGGGPGAVDPTGPKPG